MAQKYSVCLITFLLIISFFIFSLPVNFVYADGDSPTESGTQTPTGSGEGGTTETGGTEANDTTNAITLTYKFGTTYLTKDINGNDLPYAWNKNDLNNLTIPLPDIDYTKYDIKNTVWQVTVGSKYSDMGKIAAEEDEDVTFKLPDGFQPSSSIVFMLQTTEIEYVITFHGLPSSISLISNFSSEITYHKGDSINLSNDAMNPFSKNNLYKTTQYNGGYVFLGWYDDENLTTKASNITEEDYGDRDVWASTRLNMITIKFSGVEYDSEQVEFGTIALYVIKDKNPTKEGYEFGGWFTDKYYTQRIVDITSIVGSDGVEYTFYAKWNKQAQPWI